MSAMSALRDPVTRCRPVVSGSPPRIKTPAARTRSQTRVAAEPRVPPDASQSHPFFLVNANADAIVATSRNCWSNAPRSTQSSNLVSNILMYPSSGSAPPTQQRREFATTSKPRPESTKSKKPSNTRTVSQAVSVDSESQAELPKYSYLNFSPTPVIKYIRSEYEANKALENINGPLGFDMEWKVTFRKAILRPVAVVQVASERVIHIIQTSAMRGAFPKKLRQLLEDPTIVKAGVNVRGDAKKLYTDHKVKIQNLVELSWLSQIADPDLICGGKPNGRQLIGLQKLVAGYLEQNLVKSEVRTGDWESKLDEEQLQYAANDAHCSVILYNRFIQLAKKHQRKLTPHLFTLSVNIHGDVVADMETPPYEEVDSEEPLLTACNPDAPTKPALATVKPRSKPGPIASTSRLLTSKAKSSVFTTATADKAPVLTTKKPPSTRPPVIIELESDTDTDEELQRLANEFAEFRLVDTTTKRQPFVSGTQVSTFTSISASRLKAQPTPTPTPVRPPLSKPKAPHPFGATPFLERSVFVSHTMAYALGIKQ